MDISLVSITVIDLCDCEVNDNVLGMLGKPLRRGCVDWLLQKIWTYQIQDIKFQSIFLIKSYQKQKKRKSKNEIWAWIELS